MNNQIQTPLVVYFYVFLYDFASQSPVIVDELNTLRSFASMFLWKDLLHLHLHQENKRNNKAKFNQRKIFFNKRMKYQNK